MVLHAQELVDDAYERGREAAYRAVWAQAEPGAAYALGCLWCATPVYRGDSLTDGKLLYAVHLTGDGFTRVPCPGYVREALVAAEGRWVELWELRRELQRLSLAPTAEVDAALAAFVRRQQERRASLARDVDALPAG